MFRIYHVIDFVYNFLAELTNIDEMFEILMKVNNVLNELTSDYLAIEDEDINDVIENASLVCNSQLKCFDFYIVKNKPLSTQR